jgi:hypothetical protein
MPHFAVAAVASAGGVGGGPPPSSATVSFSPNGGNFTTGNHNCVVTVTNSASLRWKIDAGGWTNVAALSTTVVVNVTAADKIVYADALDGSGNVLISGASGAFFHDTGN